MPMGKSNRPRHRQDLTLCAEFDMIQEMDFGKKVSAWSG